METGQELHNERAPLRLDETRVYLAEWLSRREEEAGGFSEEQIRRIHQVSGGRMDRIERLARQCLTDPAAQSDDDIPKNSPATVAVIVSVAVITIIAVIMLLSPPVERQDGPSLPVASAEKPAGLPQAATPAEPGSPPATAEPEAVEKSDEPPPVSDGTREEQVLLSGVRTRDWLMEENGDQYVLQLIGATEVKTIGNFVARAALPEHHLTLLRSRRNGEDWYTLIYGLYPDAETAREQRKRLPSWVREQNPWPRRLAEVLKDSYR